jgi:hypothetical protein
MSEQIVSVSWSGGVPSTGLVAAGIAGLLPKPDAVTFADTGAERAITYQVVKAWAPFIESHGIEVLHAPPAGHIVNDILAEKGHFADIPLYTLRPDGSTGRLARHCTAEYKIRPIRRALRDRLGASRRGRLAAGLVTQWLGYTREEVGRIGRPRVAWTVQAYPWIELGWYRHQVIEFLLDFCARHSLPMPEPSACKICPFRDDWARLPLTDAGFAVAFDATLRTLPSLARLRAGGELFLHRSCQPLPSVIAQDLESEREPAALQLGFAWECDSGACGL